ncbi:MAG: type II toxin-antitoxin system RelE/ParE family toxin [Prevotella sp.]|nr:type II toxin-antitoxin system RelE/ParE family toxin [Prevotella sp.]
MAQVIWQKRAEKELYKLLVNGFLEFGETTANRFTEQVRLLNGELQKFPEIGYPEPLLRERNKLYRSVHIQKRFKLIYYFSPSTDTVHVADIWDTKRSPEILQKRNRINRQSFIEKIIYIQYLVLNKMG